ncbi:hypothetical protein F5Y06DRAFT_256623 [Hypoxylon sp. FL0890]|nr:hypothetical protein F5Y06DRAFT_256623 [Hypoxylon sp. FL0890]
MAVVRNLIREVKLLNFYIYAQWFLLAGFVADLIMTAIVTPVLATRGTLFTHLDIKWPAYVYIVCVNVPSMVAIGWYYLIEDETTSRVRNEDLIFLFLWLLITTVHWIGYGIDLPYLASAIIFTGAVVCYGLAYLLCQSPRRTRLVGGAGVDYMLLAVPNNKMRNGYSWTGILCILGIFVGFAGFGFGVWYGINYAFFGEQNRWGVL